MMASDVFLYLSKILPLAFYPLGLSLVILLSGFVLGGLFWARISLIRTYLKIEVVSRSAIKEQ
jgi:hypothetical protein